MNMEDIAKRLETERTFVRVYLLPQQLTNGYCFGTGKPITFQNVDWFETVIDDGIEPLIAFIKGKRYYQPIFRYLVIGDHPGFTFTIDPQPESVDGGGRYA